MPKVKAMLDAKTFFCKLAGETDEDFAQTVTLIKDYKFSQVHISQFYPRPGILTQQLPIFLLS